MYKRLGGSIEKGREERRERETERDRERKGEGKRQAQWYLPRLGNWAKV